jgi:ribonuclease P protein component
MSRGPASEIGSVSSRLEFALLAEQAKRASCGVVSVSFVAVTAQAGRASVRVAYGVSRHTGGAVVRNRVRRRFRAAIHGMALAPGLYMVRPRAGVVEASFERIRTDLQTVCVRLGVVEGE